MTGTRLFLGIAAFAAVLSAQQQRTVAGTVTEFNALELGIKTDGGESARLKFGADTQVVTVAPGERDLTKAKPAAITDIVLGDRVMATFVAGLTDVRRVILITNRDIAKRNEAEREDWKTRGISGIVSSVNGDQIVLELRSETGTKLMTVKVNGKTRIRRYAPDSVRFTDALVSTTAEMTKGDQVRTRGRKSADEASVVAEDVVFGSFVTKLGVIVAVNRETGVIQLQEAATKKPLTIHITAASQLKAMPDMRAMIFPRKGEHAAPPPQPVETNGKFNLQQTMERLPAAKLEDLKVGGGVILTSTKGAKADEFTAIMLLANAGFMVQAAQSTDGMQSLSQLHGGMLAGPGGISLPTMIQ